jgi:hypothetical protein
MKEKGKGKRLVYDREKKEKNQSLYFMKRKT